MEEKEIDINNEEQILKKCGCFDYFYNCEECSRELCMFYNDILSHKIKQENNFNTRQAIIDLGRIAITLNQQDKRIKELQQQIAENNEFFNAFACKDFNEFKDFISTFMLAPHEEQTLIRELKQQLHDLPKNIVEEIEKNFTEYLPLKDKTGAGFYCRLNAILKKFGGEDE